MAEQLGVGESELLKSIAFAVDGQVGLAVVPGDRDVNELALRRALAPRAVRVFTDDDFAAHPELPKGFLGPDSTAVALVVADHSVAGDQAWVVGSNEVDHHDTGVLVGRDFAVHEWTDLAMVSAGDACPNCGEPLAVDRGIEVGQVFELGTKYSEALDARYTDEDGEHHPMVMGCYGLGISRVVAAIVEQHHDEHGIAWPDTVAPFAVHLVTLPGKGDTAEAVVAAADRVYDELTAAGVDVLYDDREASPGVKFADADLLGMPVQLTIGAKGLARGVIERKVRSTGARDELPLDGAVAALAPS